MIKMRSVFAVMTLGILGAYFAFAQNKMTFFITSSGPGNGANLGIHAPSRPSRHGWRDR